MATVPGRIQSPFLASMATPVSDPALSPTQDGAQPHPPGRRAFSISVPTCDVCSKAAYPLESYAVDGKNFHKTCFRCTKCSNTLTPGKYAAVNSKYYCKPHFAELFKNKGNYDEGFGTEQHKRKWSRAGATGSGDSVSSSAVASVAASTVNSVSGSPTKEKGGDADSVQTYDDGDGASLKTFREDEVDMKDEGGFVLDEGVGEGEQVAEAAEVEETVVLPAEGDDGEPVAGAVDEAEPTATEAEAEPSPADERVEAAVEKQAEVPPQQEGVQVPPATAEEKEDL